jgi:hypothetical protein
LPIKHPPDDQQFHFEGFSSPNGTYVPDDLFDLLAPRLTEAELRTLLYIIRRTFGFGKNADAISLRQLTEGIVARDGRILDYGTGMSRKGVIAGIKGLLDKGIINVERCLDERGENQVNVYTLRFREGVVTQSNYRGNRSALPLVTQGNPQDSVLQEPVEQQRHTTGAGTPEAGLADDVVVRYNDPALGRPDLYEAMRDLGVHHHTAGKLLREYDHAQIEQMIGFVSQRLQKGWTPQESVAGWLVAAIRRHYEPPSSFRGAAAVAQDQAQADEQRAVAVEADRAETQRVEEELRRQRAGKLLALGIDEHADQIWQQAQAQLRENDQWSIALSMCFLKNIEGDLAILLVPGSVKKRVSPHHDAIVSALRKVTGRALQLIMHETRT